MSNLRKAHVYRVYKTDDQGNILDSDIWVDVMRIDRITFDEQRGTPNGSAHINRRYIVLWGDNTVDPATGRTGGDSSTVPSKRKYKFLKIYQPDEKGGAPTSDTPSLDMPIIKRTWFTLRGGQSGTTAQDAQWVFRNDHDGPTGREFTTLRITNNDLNSQDTAFFGKPPKEGEPQPPMPFSQQVPWDDYFQAMQKGTIDKTQYVDIEVDDRATIRSPPSPWDQSGLVAAQAQEVTYVLVNRQVGGGPIGIEDWFGSPPGTGDVYRLDPFQAIVNVNWGVGGVFAAGANGPNTSGLIRNAIASIAKAPNKNSKQHWSDVFALDGSFFDFRGAAYGNPENKDTGIKTPTFVMGGIQIVESGPPATLTYFTFIMTSTDGGVSWTRTHNQERGFINAMAYDPTDQVFYAQGPSDINFETGKFQWITLSSEDGQSWGEGGASAPGGFGDNLDWASPTITDICDPIYQDSDGNNCPGGIYGYDKKKKIVIAPYPVIPAFRYAGRAFGHQIQRIDHGDSGVGDAIMDVDGMDDVYGVAFAGGIWTVGGLVGPEPTTGVIATSVDDGDTWKIVYSPFDQIMQVMLGAPRADFSAKVWAAIPSGD